MIIANGYIRVKTLTEGGLDGNGYPVASTEKLSRFIECQYRATNVNLAAQSQTGEPTVSQNYTILIESTGEPFVAESIILYDSRKTVVGEFEVTRIGELSRLEQIRLYV